MNGLGEDGVDLGYGIEEDEPSHVLRDRHELIFFGSKERKFIPHPMELKTMTGKDLYNKSNKAISQATKC